ncbi:unnamed protein product [Periconia digitata]|uniref:Uncharacterized protein n=1 Tax=Periconia digitata TaxID=1303443 RepID=A0A9W4XPA2_9PLEO|nr:unnamed protein product [Periconia digitata]
MKPIADFKMREDNRHGDAHNSFEMQDMRSHPGPHSPRYSLDSKGDRSATRILSDYDNRPNTTFSTRTTIETFRSISWHLFAVVMSLPIALSPIIILATVAEEASVNYILGRSCYPNGLWKEAEGATWRIMDSSYFFTPNLYFGAMTFSQVKVIDIAWDLVVGRGGQMLLAYANYRVFNEWLLYHLELHLTSYKLYTAVAFQTTTMATLGVLAKEFLSFGKGTWRRFFRWLAMLCMLISTLYVLAFPTLMAAMTGYISTYRAYVEDHENNLIDFDKVRRVDYIISNGSRISAEYQKDLVVTEYDKDLLRDVEAYLKEFVADDDWKAPQITDVPIEPGFHEYLVQNRTSKFGNKDLAEPTLSIIVTYRGLPPKTVSEGLVEMYYTLSDSNILESGRQGDYYSALDVLKRGSCKPTETYQWGFSYIFMFMVSIFNFVWSCIMAGMWWDTTRGSRMYKAGRRPGLLRSIMDISAAIREELGSQVEDMGEDEIRIALRESEGRLVVPERELRVGRVDGHEPTEGIRKRSWKVKITKGSTF